MAAERARDRRWCVVSGEGYLPNWRVMKMTTIDSLTDADLDAVTGGVNAGAHNTSLNYNQPGAVSQ
jgi:hypothetical protein